MYFVDRNCIRGLICNENMIHEQKTLLQNMFSSWSTLLENSTTWIMMSKLRHYYPMDIYPKFRLSTREKMDTFVAISINRNILNSQLTFIETLLGTLIALGARDSTMAKTTFPFPGVHCSSGKTHKAQCDRDQGLWDYQSLLTWTRRPGTVSFWNVHSFLFWTG